MPYEQPVPPERLNGMVTQVVFQSAGTGFCVLELLLADGDTVTVVGELAGVAPGEELTLGGSWTEHPSFGRQFKAVSCEYRLPDTESAILLFLSSGVLCGVGPVMARRIVDEFGARTLDILQTDCELLAQRVRGISLSKARQIGRDFNELVGLRECVDRLGRLGVSARRLWPPIASSARSPLPA